MHGGTAPQNIQAARRRLLEAADPLAAELIRIAQESKDDRTRVAAIRDVLDRAGVDMPKRLEITHISDEVLLAERDRLLAERDELDD